MDQKALGIHGEQLAVGYLRSLGYNILYTNWRFGKIELDIIASNNQVISFIEVKTRENNYLGEPWQSVTIPKQNRIIKAANHYIVENRVDLECRFDIVSIIHNSKYTEIEHLKDAFYAMA